MKKQTATENHHSTAKGKMAGWVFGSLVISIGLLNLIFIHPVPGLVFITLGILLLPPADAILQKALGFSIPPAAKVIIGLVVIWFTLGVSDLGDLIDG